MESQCLVEPEARVHGVLRFLHAQARIIEDVEGRPLESLECGGRLLLPWDEGEVREIELRAPLEREDAISFSLADSESIEEVRGPGGELAGRIRRRGLPLQGIVRVRAERVEPRLARLSLRVENHTPCADATASRSEALRSSCIATHLLLGASCGGGLGATRVTASPGTDCMTTHSCGGQGRADG